MDVYTFPDCDILYPVTKMINNSRVYDSVRESLGVIDSEFDVPMEIFYMGSSGCVLATIMAREVQNAPPAAWDVDLAFTQVAKENANTHRSTTASTNTATQKEGHLSVFLDDFIATGSTLKTTREQIIRAERRAWHTSIENFDGFDGIIVHSGGVNQRIDADFIIKPEQV